MWALTKLRAALLGAALMIPAIVLVTGGVLQSVFGLNGFNDAINYELVLFHPLIIIGGIIAGLAVNLRVIFLCQVKGEWLIGTLRLPGHWANVAIIAAALLTLIVIFIYLLAENLQIFST